MANRALNWINIWEWPAFPSKAGGWWKLNKFSFKLGRLRLDMRCFANELSIVSQSLTIKISSLALFSCSVNVAFKGLDWPVFLKPVLDGLTLCTKNHGLSPQRIILTRTGCHRWFPESIRFQFTWSQYSLFSDLVLFHVNSLIFQIRYQFCLIWNKLIKLIL